MWWVALAQDKTSDNTQVEKHPPRESWVTHHLLKTAQTCDQASLADILVVTLL